MQNARFSFLPDDQEQVKRLRLALQKPLKRPWTISGLTHPTAQAAWMATAAPALLRDRGILWCVENEKEKRYLIRLLNFFCETQHQEAIAWSLEDLTTAWHNLLRRHLVVATWNELLLPIFSPWENIQKNSLPLTRHQRVPQSDVLAWLEQQGYNSHTSTPEPGFFRKRGGVMDIFCWTEQEPVRIEWNDRTIEQIRLVESDAKIEKITLTPTVIMDPENPALNWWQLQEEMRAIPWSAPWTLVTSAMPDGVKPVAATVLLDPLTANTETNGNHHSAYHTKRVPSLAHSAQQRAETLAAWQREGATLTMVSINPDRARALLGDHISVIKVDPPFMKAFEGWQDTLINQVVIGDFDLFGFLPLDHHHKRADLSFIMELRKDDYVVHLDHGIGQFRGTTHNLVEHLDREYIILEYADGDKLFVPIETSDKLSKYIGSTRPAIHRLSSSAWSAVTERIRKEALDIARDLIELYAQRARVGTTPLDRITAEERELAQSFPYEETPDQEQAIADVLHDLSQDTPMDRLVCGDVGFGKTEVAIRAAFRAIMNGKQVAVLSPTTILTQQHYDTFSERLKKFPVRIGLLSRFETKAEQDETVRGICDGTVDIVIGTHRLLSNDIQFKNLGLIVIDEEQSFGVQHKEQLKQLRKEAHILTLTATPIPRTLHFALSGLRNISMIATPPEGRLPIHTTIQPHSTETVVDAISRELKRRGQVYYLYNNVETIEIKKRDLQKLIPKARFHVAHGQLPEQDLAEAMEYFDHGDIDVLVCSTIVQNGLDLPNVNTLIVENATRFGLAQLYQLRGRIGRGERQAYAFFLYPQKKLTGTSKKRLQALQEANELGSGFELAMRDLEIRGAGNLLGREQHGNVSAIGINLYLRILNQAIQEVETGEPMPAVRDLSVDLPLEYGIDPIIEPEEPRRLKLYQQLASLLTVEQLHQWKKDLEEKYRLEKELQPKAKSPRERFDHLFELFEIRVLALNTELSSIDTAYYKDDSGQKHARLVLAFDEVFPHREIVELVAHYPQWMIKNATVEWDIRDRSVSEWCPALKKSLKILQKKKSSAPSAKTA